MAFTPNTLTFLSSSYEGLLWAYVTEDTLAQIREPGYFTPSRRLQVGDNIAVDAADGNTTLLVETTQIPHVVVRELGTRG